MCEQLQAQFYNAKPASFLRYGMLGHPAATSLVPPDSSSSLDLIELAQQPTDGSGARLRLRRGNEKTSSPYILPSTSVTTANRRMDEAS